MLNFPKSVRIFIATSPIDMRRQFDGLAGAVREHLSLDPDEGDLFVFCNKRGHLLKILFADKQGYCLLCKRLEKGRFKLPRDIENPSFEITTKDLETLLRGESYVKNKKAAKKVKTPIAKTKDTLH